MADRIIRGDSGNAVIIQNNAGSRKIEVTNSGDVEVTGDVKTTTVKATNLKANDGSAGLVIADSTGQVTSTGKIDLNGNELILDADADSSITADTDDQIDFKTAGSDRLIIDSVGDVYSTAFTTRTWSTTGLAGGSVTVHTGGYKRIGKMVIIQGYVEGTSDANTFTITNLPYAAKTNYHFSINIGLAESGGSLIGDASGTVYGSTLTFWKASNNAGWATSGTKKAIFSGWYELESI